MNEPGRIAWLFKALMDCELNDWEQTFFGSVEKQYQRRGSLTDTQYEKLEEIYGRHQ